MKLRARVLVRHSDIPEICALQTSFYSPARTDMPGVVTTDDTWKAFAQHDFRYMIGPNSLARREWRKDRTEADVQLGRNVRVQSDVHRWVADVHTYLERSPAAAIDGWVYTPTPFVESARYRTLIDIYRAVG
ncbi:hypothetical protein [Streptomyces sp. NBC_00648]|uniref:hypothetical protein n=1 Tax=Streptomyces sp. NBC_00648 TaxID=2975797 RepID=UPI002F90A13A